MLFANGARLQGYTQVDVVRTRWLPHDLGPGLSLARPAPTGPGNSSYRDGAAAPAVAGAGAARLGPELDGGR